MNGTEEIGCCGAYCKTAVNSENLQGLQTGASGRLSGFKPGQIQDEEMLPDQRPCHLWGL